MLVLSRHADESLVIGGGLVTVTVVDVHRGKARLGVDAPAEIDVHRLEVFLRIREQVRARGEDLPPDPPALARLLLGGERRAAIAAASAAFRKGVTP